MTVQEYLATVAASGVVKAAAHVACIDAARRLVALADAPYEEHYAQQQDLVQAQSELTATCTTLSIIVEHQL
jgi:hypothetical protein